MNEPNENFMENEFIEEEPINLESVSEAIVNTVSAAQYASGLTLLILQNHLEKLCKFQRKQIIKK